MRLWLFILFWFSHSISVFVLQHITTPSAHSWSHLWNVRKTSAGTEDVLVCWFCFVWPAAVLEKKCAVPTRIWPVYQSTTSSLPLELPRPLDQKLLHSFPFHTRYYQSFIDYRLLMFKYIPLSCLTCVAFKGGSSRMDVQM